MTPKQFELEIRYGCQAVCENRKLKDDDIREWSTSKDVVMRNIDPEIEIYVEVPFLGVHCAVLKTADKRKPVPALNADTQGD